MKPQTFQILLALADHDLYGSEIMQEVLERMNGQMHLWPGQLYGSLKRLADDGHVVEIDVPPGAACGGGRPRYYSITSEGKKVLVDEVQRLAGYLDAARAKKLLRRLETR